MIQVESLSVGYGARQVLRNVSFSTAQGELLAVLGPNGVGKTTLFRCMLGLKAPTGGRVLLDGDDVRQLSARELADRAAYIPQSHYPAFHYTVYDMVLMGTAHGLSPFVSPGRAQQKQAEQALARLDITALADRYYTQLSGGQQQLVLIARALAQQARILFMDEPASGLDFGNRIKLMEQVRRLTEEGYTVVLSSHDPQTALTYADRVLALHSGGVLACGTAREVITEATMGALYGVPFELLDGRVIVPKGAE